ncbi:MAG: hypothetical protein RLZZ65_951 [Bacteroidota bacterium]|jgi:tRNA1Val (adenine37-N6)-methyltransferase
MSVFHFRDFSIWQEISPLKVGTDALLLGASVQIPEANATLLDVGTGTGVVALILASRFQQIQVVALEPNELAFNEAKLNLENAPFQARLSIHFSSVEAFQRSDLFDVIVSNPPYFLDNLKGKETALNEAKHLTKDAYFGFLAACLNLLKHDGFLWLILPKDVALKTIAYLEHEGFFVQQKIRFHSNESKLDTRWVLSFSRIEQVCQETALYIRNLDGTYHADYIKHVGYLHAKAL